MCANPPGLRTIRPAEVVLSAVEDALTVACHDVRMNKATWAMLNDSEKDLLRSAERASLARLDEDALVDLHARVRRARRKYTMLYRRRASSQVEKDRDRAKAHAQHARTAAKAEAFEDALARVSYALAKAARARAVALRRERLEAAGRRSEASLDRPRGNERAEPAGGGRKGVTHQRTPISQRASASARARTRGVQAARDAR